MRRVSPFHTKARALFYQYIITGSCLSVCLSDVLCSTCFNEMHEIYHHWQTGNRAPVKPLFNCNLYKLMVQFLHVNWYIIVIIIIQSTAIVWRTNKHKNMYTYIFSRVFPLCLELCKQKVYCNKEISHWRFPVIVLAYISVSSAPQQYSQQSSATVLNKTIMRQNWKILCLCLHEWFVGRFIAYTYIKISCNQTVQP